MLDDIGTKVPLARLEGFEVSWLTETSPINYQAGILFDELMTDGPAVVRLLGAIVEAGLCDAGAKGPLTRWARLPAAIIAFAEAPKSLITNARCLTEGVDIPTVDMVAFIDPRQSRVDIVQAVGRAMRKPRRVTTKTVGYVLVPLLQGLTKIASRMPLGPRNLIR